MKKEQKEKTYTNIKITKLLNSEVEIEGEITKEEMGRVREEAIKELKNKAELPGFRKGHVPENVLLEKFGEMQILYDGAEIALGEAYPKIIIENNLSVISRPEISITKIAKDNPLGFKIKVPVFPEVTLPDYKKIAKDSSNKDESVLISDPEVETVIKQLQENKASAVKKADHSDEATPHSHELPEIDEAFIKSFGDFKNVEDFKNKIKENLLHEKKARLKEKKRLSLGEQLVKGSEIDLPEILVKSELNKMRLQFEDDLKKMDIKMEDYLKQLKKNQEELEKEWREPAIGRVKLQIILNKIALEEKIVAPLEEIEKEANHILEHHKDADKEKVKSYVEMMLVNEKVFEFLETKDTSEI